MLSKFGLRRRDEITIIPNGHEHVKRCCPDRSPFAATEENRHPFVFLLGSRAVHKNVEMLFSIAGELDPLGSSRRLQTASLPEVWAMPRFSPIRNRRAVGSSRSNASMPN
jgi:hypothetical protein